MYIPHKLRNKNRLHILKRCYLDPRKLKYDVETIDDHICKLIIYFKHTGTYEKTINLANANEMEYCCKEVYKKLIEEQKIAAQKEETQND